MYRIVSYVLMIMLVISTAVEARLKVAPADIIARPGEAVRFSCSTESLDSVDWRYRKDENQAYRNIFIGRNGGGGDKSSSYMISKRILVDIDVESGQYDLIIQNVTQTDQGEYVCYDISDPDLTVTAKLTIVITGDAETELCSYDVAASVGSEVQLNFSTTQSHSIHLEHQSNDRSYPLHVFRDGKIVNDYYVLSGRFDVRVSDGVWTLVIRDVQMADAGTFICSEDNGLGKQEVQELIVLEWKSMSNGEMCNAKNCTVRFAGNCPPRLEWRQSLDGETGKMKRLKSITTRGKAVITSTRIEDNDQERSLVLYCLAMTTSAVEHNHRRPCHVIQELSPCEVTAITNTIVIVFIVILAVVTILLVWFFKRRSLRCQLPQKSDDVMTPKHQPTRGVSTSVVMVVNHDLPAALMSLLPTSHNLVKMFATPTVSNVNGGDEQVSSARRRNQNSVNKENTTMNTNSVNNSYKKCATNANAKRRLSLDNSL